MVAYIGYPHRHHNRFTSGDENYFRQFATECNNSLKIFPLGTNELLHLDDADFGRLPQMIQELGVSSVWIKKDSLHLLFGGGFTTFGATWEKQNDNTWILFENGPGFQTERFRIMPE